MTEERIIKFVQNLNPEGWWKQEGMEVFIAGYKMLLDNGIEQSDIENLLEILYLAAKEEYI